MRARAKRLPRLWCALQGLLPLEVVWAVPRASVLAMAKSDAAAVAGGKTPVRKATP
jgi:hypothetical protein